MRRTSRPWSSFDPSKKNDTFEREGEERVIGGVEERDAGAVRVKSVDEGSDGGERVEGHIDSTKKKGGKYSYGLKKIVHSSKAKSLAVIRGKKKDGQTNESTSVAQSKQKDVRIKKLSKEGKEEKMKRKEREKKKKMERKNEQNNGVGPYFGKKV